MGKSKAGKSKGYTSQGKVPTAKKNILKAVRRDYTGTIDEHINKYEAYLKGKKVYVTVANPNPNETNKPFIRVSGEELWGAGDIRKMRNSYQVFKGSE